MSTLAVDAIVDSSNGNTATINGATPTAYNTMGKNRIINGAMEIDQRNAGASVTPTTSGYTLDRWQATLAAASKFSVQQSSTAPTGFKNSLLVTSLAATTVGSSDYYLIQQKIEGYNMADFDWGTANAKTVTLSFWVQSSLTGTFGGSLGNNAFNRTYPFTYTISSANTWEQKSITIAGDTSGTWLSTNGTGIQLTFGLGSGSTFSGTAGAWAGTGYQTATGATQVVATNGATFYITGVQLEVGSVATEFERRPYGTELQLCQRYYYTTDYASYPIGFFGTVINTANSLANGIGMFPITMRSAPTVTMGSADQSGVGTFTVTAQQIGTTGFNRVSSSSGNFTNNQTAVTAGFKASAEL